jgi:predicted transporter
MTHLTIKHAVLILVFSVAALLIFCEISETVSNFFALLAAVKIAGLALFGAGVYLTRKWRKELGIDQLLND